MTRGGCEGAPHLNLLPWGEEARPPGPPMFEPAGGLRKGLQRGRGRSGRSAGDAFLAEALDLAGGHAEQAAEDFVLVLAEERGAAVIEPQVR